MPYIRPIESSYDNIDKINIDHGNLLFDLTHQMMLYDTNDLQRIRLTDIIIINTELEREQLVGAIEGKLYIVLETVRAYVYRNSQWLSITVPKEETATMFYVDAVNGSDDNTGLSREEPLASIKSVFSKYPDSYYYYINLASGTYNIDSLTISSKFVVYLIGTGSTDILGELTVSAISYFTSSGCGFNDLIINNNTQATLSNIKLYENGIQVNGGSSAYISDVTISGDTASTEDMSVFNATRGSVISISSGSGKSTTRNLYKASLGSSVHVASAVTMTTSVTPTFTTNGTGKIYFEADETDAETKAYIADQISAATTEAKTYTDEQIAAFFTIEEV